jgi:hypothetical protein
MFTPTISGGDHDYFFRDLDATYDATQGRVYLLRATPYPFDMSRSDIPGCKPPSCQSGQICCPSGLGLFPLRGQLYYMNVAGDVAKTTQGTSSWTLALDLGSNSGWSYGTGTCPELSLQSMVQRDIGLDMDSLTIHKTPNGRLAKEGSNLRLFMGAWGMVDRKQSCVNAQQQQGGGAGGTWIDAELYEMSSPVP